MKKTLLLVLFFSGLSLNAQNLDSLFSEYVKIKTGGTVNVKQESVTAAGEEHEKCAFGLVNQIRENYNKFNAEQKTVLQKLLQRPVTDTSVFSPSGRFKIHFSKSDQPDYIPDNIRETLTASQIPTYKKLYLDSLGVAADSAYNYEVNILGYPAPPSDNGAGGDDKYDIYIQNLGNRTYGYTDGDEQITDNTFTSYVVMDNDFSDYNTKRIDAARVTIAHEFHHMIQIGDYIFRSEDQFYYEITSTSMEEFVFDSINDYYNDLATFMYTPQTAFPLHSGYDLAIWNLFLSSEFDVDIIKRTWELMPQERALNAIASAISERGSSFKKEFATFGYWLYFTGSRALPGKYFEEAANYPQVTPFITLSFDKPETTVNVNSEPVSTNILVFTNNVGTNIDTFVTVVSNSDITNGIDNLGSVTNFKYYLSGEPASGYRNVREGYYSKLESSADFLFAETNIFNNYLIENGIVSEEIQYAYPQPFRYSRDSYIYFPASFGQSGNVDLYIYSVDMKLVYSGIKRVLALDKVVVQWDVKDNSGGKLGSGIYFFVIKSGDSIKKGKFAVFNE